MLVEHKNIRGGKVKNELLEISIRITSNAQAQAQVTSPIPCIKNELSCKNELGCKNECC